MRVYEGESITHDLLHLFGRHPGFIVSLAYLLLTMGGVFYGWAFFKRFDVPYLQIADFSDLLISGVREPVSLVLLVGGLAVGFGFDRIMRYTYQMQKLWRCEPRSLKRSAIIMFCYTPKYRVSVGIWIIVAFVVYTWMFVALYAGWKSAQIRAGFGDPIQLYTGGQTNRPDPTLLIGSTLNYIITYDNSSGQSVITPVESVDRILPLSSATIFDD